MKYKYTNGIKMFWLLVTRLKNVQTFACTVSEETKEKFAPQIDWKRFLINDNCSRFHEMVPLQPEASI